MRSEGALLVVQRSAEGKLQQESATRSSTSFIEVFSTRDKIATVSPIDNSFVISNTSLVHFDTLAPRGLKEIDMGHETCTSYASTVDEHIFCWPCGNNDLYIIDFSTLEFDFIDDFFAGEEFGYLPISIKTVLNGRKVAALSMSKVSREYGLYHWEKSASKESNKAAFSPVKKIGSFRSFG